MSRRHWRYSVRTIDIENGRYKTTGHLFRLLNGVIIDSWPVVSGGYGRGTIQLGIYTILYCKILPDISKMIPYKLEWFPWIASLKAKIPVFDEKGRRSGFAIHPDGNVPGSLGCVVLTHRDKECFQAIQSDLRSEKKLILEVI